MTLAAIVAILFLQLTQAPATFDPAADFSFHDNPGKVWQYGYSATDSLGARSVSSRHASGTSRYEMLTHGFDRFLASRRE